MVDISPNILLKFSITHFNIIIPVYMLNNSSSLLFNVLIASAFWKKDSTREQNFILKLSDENFLVLVCICRMGDASLSLSSQLHRVLVSRPLRRNYNMVDE